MMLLLLLAVVEVDSAVVNDLDRPGCIEDVTAEEWTDDDPVKDKATADCCDSHAEKQSTDRTTIRRPGDAKEEGLGSGDRRGSIEKWADSSNLRLIRRFILLSPKRA
jgi:hypothetical protein